MRRERKVTKRIKLLRRGSAVLAVICLAVLIPATVRLYQKRKAIEAEIAMRKYVESTSSVRFRSETIEYEGKVYRRNSSVKAILCMGVDRNGPMLQETVHTFGGQSDGIYVLAQDTARGTLKILMVPRDSMTEITLTDLKGNVLGKDIQHLTLAYAYGDGRELSCERTAEAVSGLLGGLTLDHYMAADIDVINMLNDSVGGVTVTVEVDGMEKKDPAFVKGATLTLHGEQAEAYVRYRDIDEHYSAFYRMNRQKSYIMGFFDAVRENSKRDARTVEKLFELIQDHMVTDMKKEEYLKVAMDALEMGELSEEGFYSVPGDAITTDVYDEFYVNQEALTPIILELFYREVQ